MGLVWYHLTMSLISRDVDYALRALAYMAQAKGKLISTAQLERELNLPRPFMRKVLQKLENAGIVGSTKGNKGGFVLAKAPGTITIALLVEALQGGLNFGDCKLSKRPCPQMAICQIRVKLNSIEKKVLDELAAVSVASLLK